MATTRWDPFSTLARLDRDFDQIVRRTWGAAQPQVSGSPASAGFVPAIEMAQSGHDVLLTLELPGVDVDNDLDIEVHEGRLTVSGHRRDRHEEERDGLLVRELRYGAFRREFALPDGVTADDIEADYEHGLLRLRIHDVVRSAPEPRKIAIRRGAAGQQPEAVGAVGAVGGTEESG